MKRVMMIAILATSLLCTGCGTVMLGGYALYRSIFPEYEYVQQRDENGNLLFDDDGEPVMKRYEVPVFR